MLDAAASAKPFTEIYNAGTVNGDNVEINTDEVEFTFCKNSPSYGKVLRLMESLTGKKAVDVEK